MGKLISILEEGKPEYKLIYEKIYNSRIASYNTHDNITSHGLDHINAIILNIELLLGDEINNLSNVEVFILLISIYLHDISMSIGKRKNHHIYSSEIVRTTYIDIITDTNVLSIICDVIRAHGEDDLDQFINGQPNNKYVDGYFLHVESNINVASLMALLRMGDMIDWCKDRAPKMIMNKRPVDGVSYTHWFKHQLINYIVPDKTQTYIEVSCNIIGPYTVRKINEMLEWFNSELGQNRKYLNRLNLYYQEFLLDYESKVNIENALKTTIKFDNPFKPFESYDQEEYDIFFGRENDIEDLINHIFHDKDEKAITILTGKSGVGKTSLLRCGIVNIFNEYKFEVKYLSDYANFELFNDDDVNNDNILIVLDQFERNESIQDTFEWIQDNVIDKHNTYLVISVTTEYIPEIIEVLKEMDIKYSTSFLSPIDSYDVVLKLMNANEIQYDENLVRDIINEMLFDNKNDTILINVLFYELINIDRKLLYEIKKIQEEYIDISHLVKDVLADFFMHLFSDLVDKDFNILNRACNEKGSSTRRANTINTIEQKRVYELAENKILNVYENASRYEFKHDRLAHYYYENILSNEDKEINILFNRIVNHEILDQEMLLKIQFSRSKLSQMIDDDIFYSNIIFSYIINYHDEYRDEYKFWFNKISNISVLIELIILELVRYNSSRRIKTIVHFMLTIVNFDEEILTSVKKILKDIIANSFEYKRTAIAQYLSNTIYKYKFNYSNAIHIENDIGKVLYNNDLETLYDEMYAYCHVNELIDNLINRCLIPREAFEVIKKMVEAYKKNESIYFFGELVLNSSYEKNENMRKKVLNLLFSALSSGENSLTKRKARIDVHNMSITLLEESKANITIPQSQKLDFVRISLGKDIYVGYINNEVETILVFVNHQDEMDSDYFCFDDILHALFDIESILCSNVINSNQVLDSLDKLKNEFVKKVKGLDDIDVVISIFNSFIEKHKSEISNIIIECDQGNEMYVKYHPAVKFIYGILLLLDSITNELKIENPFDKAKVYMYNYDLMDNVFNEVLPIYNSFCILKDNYYIDPYGIRGTQIKEANSLIYRSLNANSVNRIDKTMVYSDIIHMNNSMPNLLVLIGNKYDSLFDGYKRYFSFFINWDDRISNVSKAIDSWEYELYKVLYVLYGNKFINNLIIVGDVNSCKSATNKLKEIILGNSNSNRTEEGHARFNHFFSTNRKKENNVKISIINVKEMINDITIIKNMNKILYQNYCETECSKLYEFVETQKIKKSTLTELCTQYLNKNEILEINKDNIKSETLDEAYKSIIASLKIYGRKTVDSYGKNIIELDGVNLRINATNDINNLRMTFRRNEIDNYYENQWIKTSGEIENYINSYNVFSINQYEIMLRNLAECIREKRVFRKVMLTFYNPNYSLQNGKAVPSLIDCFLMPKFEQNLTKLDVFFTWRSSECVLGLPLSLECSIRWVQEVVITDVEDILQCKNEVIIGEYNYYGINMHLYDNDIMDGIIIKIFK